MTAMKLTAFGIWGCLVSLFCLEVGTYSFFNVGYVLFYPFAALTLIGLMTKWRLNDQDSGSENKDQSS